jgi:hypothetical protein
VTDKSRWTVRNPIGDQDLKAVFLAVAWRLGRSLLLTGLFMLALIAAVLPLVLLNWRIPALIAASLLWLIGSGFMFARTDDVFDGWAFICSAFPVLMVAYAMPDYLALRATTTVHVNSVVDIQPPLAGRAFDFAQADIQSQFSATYTSRTYNRDGSSSRRDYTVAPLTTLRWNADQPVLAWVGCTETYATTCDEWKQDYHVGVLASDWDQSDLRVAVERAVKKYDLHSADDAPIFKWTPSVQAEAERQFNLILFVCLLGYGLWAAPKIAVTVWHSAAVRSRSKN